MIRYQHYLRFLMACLVLAIVQLPIFAQTETIEDTELPKPIPIAVAMASGVEHTFTEMDYIFESIGHPELSDLVYANLSNLRDLQGIDQSRPLGLMIFLKPPTGFNFFPTPAFAGFIPVDDFEEFQQTLASTGSPIAKVPETDDRYTLTSPGQTFYFEQIGDHVILSNDETLFEVELPDPAALTKTLSTRYDVAAQVNISNIPVAMRNVVLDFLRAQMETEMQRRDEEPEGPWRMRKASISNNLQFIEQLATQGDSVTVGLDVSKEDRRAVVEVDLNARPGSQFAKHLGDSGKVTSYFRALQNDPAIISAYASWQMQDEVAENMKEIALGLQQAIQYNVEEEDPLPDGQQIQLRLDGLFACLADTAESGTLDSFVRMQPTATGESVVLASIRVINGTTAALTIADLLELLNSREGGDVDFQLNVDSYRGVNFHRLQPGDSERDQGSRRIFGDDWALYFGAGERTLWFVMGADQALPAAHDAIDKILDPASQQSLPDAAPFRFTMNMSQWIALFENPDRERRGFGKVIAETMEAGDDRIIADMAPKENGIRYRIRFEEGFVKLIGLGVSRALGLPVDEL